MVIRTNKNMCVYGHPTDPIFQPPTLTFLFGNYSTLIFASDPINFYTEFGDSSISFLKFPVSRHLLKLFYEELRCFSTFFALNFDKKKTSG
jgi:hypothetical protein